MPKKSKREKILADVRRRVRTERVLSVSPSVSPIHEHAKTFRFTLSDKAKPQEAPLPVNTSELTAIKKDLTKTIVLATVAIAAEVALYWFGKGNI